LQELSFSNTDGDMSKQRQEILERLNSEEEPKTKTVYVCVFQFMGARDQARSEDGIGDFRHGFWLNEDKEFTKGSDCKHWIPPSKIEHVMKCEVGV